MTIDGILIAANKMHQLFGNLNLEIRDIEYYKGRIVFKTTSDWYSYSLEEDSVTVYTDESHTTYY